MFKNFVDLYNNLADCISRKESEYCLLSMITLIYTIAFILNYKTNEEEKNGRMLDFSTI